MITYRRILYGLALWLAFLSAHAWGQSIEAPRRVDVVTRVHDACPGLVLNDHAFTDAVASVLYAEDNRWGRNGKRGNVNDLSHDALAFKNPASPAGGVSIVDIIVAAGSAAATPGWGDVTAETIRQKTVGAWVQPSGVLPPCLTREPVPVPEPNWPTPTPTPAPAPTVDLTPVLDVLARLDARLAALEARPSPSLDLFAAYVDDMVGNGPADDPKLLPNHVTDIKTRLDVIRTDLEQLNAWLRSRGVLRW